MKRLSFEHDHGHGVIVGMAQGNERACDLSLIGELLCATGQDEKGLATRLAMNVDIFPTHRFPDAGSEGF